MPTHHTIQVIIPGHVIQVMCTQRVVMWCCRNVQYIERDGTEFFHTLKVFPEALNKKMTLLKYFRNYMSEHLLKVNCRTLIVC